MKRVLLITVYASAMMVTNGAWAVDCPATVCDPEEYTCQCNDHGKIIKKMSNYNDDIDVYTYDEGGKMLITATTYYGEDDFVNNRPSEQYHYTYANGKMISQTEYYGAANIASNTPSSQERWTFDANGNMTSHRSYYNAKNIASDNHDSQTLYTYDESGNMLILETYYDGANPEGQFRYIYDETGEEIDVVETFCSEEPCIPVGDIVCAIGYVKGCVGAEITLPNGTSAKMKNGEIFNNSPDGSTTLYNADGTIKGFKGKRIYTIDEANLVAKPTGNTVRIKYR